MVARPVEKRGQAGQAPRDDMNAVAWPRDPSPHMKDNINELRMNSNCEFVKLTSSTPLWVLSGESRHSLCSVRITFHRRGREGPLRNRRNQTQCSARPASPRFSNGFSPDCGFQINRNTRVYASNSLSLLWSSSPLGTISDSSRRRLPQSIREFLYGSFQLSPKVRLFPLARFPTESNAETVCSTPASGRDLSPPV